MWKRVVSKRVVPLLAFAVAGLSALASGESVVWEEPRAVAAGEGHQGPWRMNASDYRFVDDPTVAMTAGGAVAVAWVDQGKKDVLLQVFEPNGDVRFPKAVNVSRSPEVFSWLPRVAIPATDPERVYILWQEIIFSGGSHGGEIFFARSDDGGRTFSTPANLSKSSAGDGKGRLTRKMWHNGSLDLVVGPEGNLYAAWTEYEGRLWFSRSTDGGESFSEPLHVWGGDETPARAPSLAAGGEGRVGLAWTVGEDAAADIRFAPSTDGGKTFGEPRPVARTRGHGDGPKIALDRSGTVHLVYAESQGGPLGEYRLVYSRKSPGEENFQEPREIAAPAGEWKSIHFPGVALDGDDTLYVVGELFPSPKSRPRGVGFTLSVDGGQTFAPPASVPGSADEALGTGGGRQGLLMRKLAVNHDGEIAVVHSTFKEGEESRILLIRGRRGG